MFFLKKMANMRDSKQKVKKRSFADDEVLPLFPPAIPSVSPSLTKNLEDRRLPSLPHDIKVDIALKLSRLSLTSIGSIMASGKEGRSMILNSEFRKHVDLSRFIQNSQLISRSVNFFHDCVEDDNTQALYLHGLESLCVYGELDNGLFFIERAANLGDNRAMVMHALIWVCSGFPESGKELLAKGLHTHNINPNQLNSYAKEIELTLLQFCHSGYGVFEKSWYCPFPECEFNHAGFVCSLCFMYRHSIIIKNLC